MRISWDTSEVDGLVNDLRRVPGEVSKRNVETGTKDARRIRDGWRKLATESAGKHGYLYPRTIKDHLTGALEWKIEPDVSMDQGGMNFEYGGPSILVNITPGQIARGAHIGQRVGQNAPHLDMNKTMDIEGPKFVEDVAGDVLPWW